MKKSIISLILLSVLTMGLLAGCSGKSKFSKPSIYIAGTSDLFSVEILQNSITSTGLSLVITNLSNTEAYYDMFYYIEQNKNGVWHASDEEIAFIAIAAILPANESSEFAVDWEEDSLPKGEYRVLKPMLGESETVYLAAEFNIK